MSTNNGTKTAAMIVEALLSEELARFSDWVVGGILSVEFCAKKNQRSFQTWKISYLECNYRLLEPMSNWNNSIVYHCSRGGERKGWEEYVSFRVKYHAVAIESWEEIVPVSSLSRSHLQFEGKREKQKTNQRCLSIFDGILLSLTNAWVESTIRFELVRFDWVDCHGDLYCLVSSRTFVV
jgi:hypothetical protein